LLKFEAGKQVLKPGESIRRDIADGGAICLLRVKVDADDIEQAMRSTVIRAEFDGKQRVWAPVGGFFGSGPGLNPLKGWWRQVAKDGWMTCWWPMPFREKATIAVTNHGNCDVTVELGDVGVADWTWTDRTMYFQSCWRGDDHIAVFGNNYVLGEEWNYVRSSRTRCIRSIRRRWKFRRVTPTTRSHVRRGRITSSRFNNSTATSAA